MQRFNFVLFASTGWWIAYFALKKDLLDTLIFCMKRDLPHEMAVKPYKILLLRFSIRYSSIENFNSKVGRLPTFSGASLFGIAILILEVLSIACNADSILRIRSWL